MICDNCKEEKGNIETVPCVAFNLADQKSVEKRTGAYSTTTTVSTYTAGTPIDINVCDDCIEGEIAVLERQKRKDSTIMIIAIMIFIVSTFSAVIYQAISNKMEIPAYFYVLIFVTLIAMCIFIRRYRYTSSELRIFKDLKSYIMRKNSVDAKAFHDQLFRVAMLMSLKPAEFRYIYTKERYELWKMENMTRIMEYVARDIQDKNKRQ